jgi:hypothetical protein
MALEDLWKMSEVELLSAYAAARRQHVEKKFARDTQRARVQWLRARAFATAVGTNTERMNAVDATEDLARKGQEVREMTRDLDLLKVDLDVIAMVIRLRGAPEPTEGRLEEPPVATEDARGGDLE